MGLVSRKGTMKKVDNHGVNAVETNRIVPDNVLDAKDRDIDKLVKVEDTFATRSAINPESYPDEFKMLIAYPLGSPVHVNYFFQNLPDIDHLSAMSDLSIVEHHIHKDLTEVRKLEIRLLNSMEPEFKDEDNSWQLNIDALMYPGREPHIGDVFLFETGNNKIVQFSVNNVTPTTYRQGTYFRITANSYQFATSDSLAELRNCVTSVFYFDKHKFFEDGRLTLLNHQSYIDLQKLRHYRKEIIEVYMNKFYREDFESVVYFNNIYDPYLVEYLKNKISLLDYPRRPEQIDTTLIDYEKSIWYKLSLSVAPHNLDDIYTSYKIVFNKANPLSPSNNRLDNNKKIQLIEAKGSLSNSGSYLEDKSNNKYGDSSSIVQEYVTCEHCGETTYIRSTGYYICRHCGYCSHCKHVHYPRCEWDHDHCHFRCDNPEQNHKGDSSNSNSSGSFPAYGFSSYFYYGELTKMDKFERVIYSYLNYLPVKPEELISVLDDYRKLSDSKKYYYLPALLAVIDWTILELGR